MQLAVCPEVYYKTVYISIDPWEIYFFSLLDVPQFLPLVVFNETIFWKEGKIRLIKLPDSWNFLKQ